VRNGLALTLFFGQRLGKLISTDEQTQSESESTGSQKLSEFQKSLDDSSLIITLFGFSGAGKTCFYKRVTEAFYHNFSPTIGVDAFQSEFIVRNTDACSSSKVKVRIHDICGQLYRSLPLLVSVLKHAHGFLVVIDSTKSKTEAERDIVELLDLIKEIGSLQPPCILFVLSKIDSDEAQINGAALSNVLKKFCVDYEFKCIETSAKVDINVNIAVKNLVQMVFNRNIKKRDIYRFYEEPGMSIYMEKKKLKAKTCDIEKSLESQMRLMQLQIDQQMKLIRSQMNQIQEEIQSDDAEESHNQNIEEIQSSSEVSGKHALNPDPETVNVAE